MCRREERRDLDSSCRFKSCSSMEGKPLLSRTTIPFSAVPSCSFQLICTFIFETEQYVGRCIERLVGQIRYLFQKIFFFFLKKSITSLGKASSVAK